MFGFGLWEFILALVVALLVLGPEKLPRIARTMGKGMRELRKAMNEFQTSLSTADINSDYKPRAPQAPKQVAAATDASLESQRTTPLNTVPAVLQEGDAEGQEPPPTDDEQSPS